MAHPIVQSGLADYSPYNSGIEDFDTVKIKKKVDQTLVDAKAGKTVKTGDKAGDKVFKPAPKPDKTKDGIPFKDIERKAKELENQAKKEHEKTKKEFEKEKKILKDKAEEKKKGVIERNNKRMKGMVRSNLDPEASFANDIQVDIATRVTSLEKDLLDAEPPPLITVSSPIIGGLYFPTKRQRY